MTSIEDIFHYSIFILLGSLRPKWSPCDRNNDVWLCLGVSDCVWVCRIVSGCVGLCLDNHQGLYKCHILVAIPLRMRTRKKKSNVVSLKQSIYARLISHLPSKSSEKSSHGEVFTPPVLIEELCDAFPSSIWKRTDVTWLDPSAGIGNFPIVLFFRYMEGLQSAFPDPVTRSSYIIEHILFMVEINPVNVKQCRSLFRTLCPSATPRIHQGDFLSSLPKNWPSHFTVVIGNPPYNLHGTKRIGTKRAHIPFTERGLALLAPSGYIGYICPPSYRQAHTPMNRLFQDAGGHFRYLHILGAKDTYQHFRIQGRVDLFLYQRDVGNGPTSIMDEYHIHTPSIHLSLHRHIPNFGHSIFQKLFSLVDTYGHVEGYRTTEMTTVHSHTFGCRGKHPLLHLIVENGKRIYRTTTPHSLIGVPKLFINGLGVPYVFYDKSGVYGASQTPILVLRPRPDVVTLLQSPLFTFIAWGLRLTGNNNLPYLLDAVPLVSLKDIPLTKKEEAWYKEHFSVPLFIHKDIIIPCSSSTRKKRKEEDE
jgi:hypothetical protein